MKFFVTMHMPPTMAPKGGDPPRLIHQMIVEHKSPSLEDFKETLIEDGYVVVREYFKDNKSHDSPLVEQGDILINGMHIGKVKVYVA